MNLDKPLFITQHLGLGDAIICQAIVKTYARQYCQIDLPIDFRFEQSISMIYRQYSDINFIKLNNENNQGYKQISLMINNYQNVLRIGFFSPLYNNIINKYKTLNSTFYIPARLPLETQWKIPVLSQRNKDRQIQLFKQYNIQEKQYVLIIQDENRYNQNGKRMILDRRYIVNDELPIVVLQYKSDNIFDNCYLLQNAKQIHTYDTAMTTVIDQCCEINPEIVYVHKYIRPQQKRARTVYKHNYNQIW